VAWHKDRYADQSDRIGSPEMTHFIWSDGCPQGCPKYTMWKGQSLQQTMPGKLDIYMQKNEVGPTLYTIYKNQLEMD
jgi:hypothetical protein